MGITVNVLRNTARAKRRHERALARLPRGEPLPDFADELVRRMADADQISAAKSALGKLGRADRQVFVLCVWSGLSYAETAEALGVRVGTVRSRLSRARERLRRLTNDELAARREPVGGGGQGRGDRRLSAVRSSEERHR
jgi:RNA polymerase sigma-70 factor (ECF subfamily)